jgi:hypothetical protein
VGAAREPCRPESAKCRVETGWPSKAEKPALRNLGAWPTLAGLPDPLERPMIGWLIAF